MQGSNVIIMPHRAINPDPEGLSAIWRSVHGLEKTIKDLQDPISKPSFWSRIWKERAWLIPLVFVLLAALSSGVWYVGGLILDKHIQSGLTPVQNEIKTLNGDVDEIKGTLKVLQSQFVVQKYANVQPKELKQHTDELKVAKIDLAKTDHNVPGFWPTSFQIITLLSQATSQVEPISSQKESVISDVSGPGIEISEGIHVLLKNRITDMVFKNTVVRFDRSVRLANVTFINCILIFPPMEQNPPRPLQKIGSELLAADLSHVTVAGGS